MLAEAELPTFSIVVPTRARPHQLIRCLRALRRIDYPAGRYDVIVVDDGTPEPLEPRVRASLADAPLADGNARIQVRVVRQEHAGPATARNTGVAVAGGTYIAFTDDDCEPQPGWLRAFAAAFDRAPDHLLGGRTRNALADNPYAAASQQLVEYLYEYYDGSDGRPRLFTSNNLAVSRRLFTEEGGFDHGFARAAGEDREFCDRWGRGRATTYVPDAVVDHAHPLTLAGFLRQHYNYGRGARDYRRARREAGEFGRGLEPPSFYAGLLRYPFRSGSGLEPWLRASALALAQVLTAAGYFGGTVRR